jgi:hypothetical protein
LFDERTHTHKHMCGDNFSLYFHDKLFFAVQWFFRRMCRLFGKRNLITYRNKCAHMPYTQWWMMRDFSFRSQLLWVLWPAPRFSHKQSTQLFAHWFHNNCLYTYLPLENKKPIDSDTKLMFLFRVQCLRGAPVSRFKKPLTNRRSSEFCVVFLNELSHVVDCRVAELDPILEIDIASLFYREAETLHWLHIVGMIIIITIHSFKSCNYKIYMFVLIFHKSSSKMRSAAL